MLRFGGRCPKWPSFDSIDMELHNIAAEQMLSASLKGLDVHKLPEGGDEDAVAARRGLTKQGRGGEGEGGLWVKHALDVSTSVVPDGGAWVDSVTCM